MNNIKLNVDNAMNDAVSITVIATGFDDVTSLEQIKENFLASTTESVSAVKEEAVVQETIASEPEKVEQENFAVSNEAYVEPQENLNHENHDYQAAEAIAGAPSFSQVSSSGTHSVKEETVSKKTPITDETDFNLEVPAFLRDLP